MQKKIEDICSHFHIYGDFVVAIPCGNGHINDTYQLTFDQGGTLLHYTLQRINTNVFKQPAMVMENFSCVTAHILNKIRQEKKRNPQSRRRTLRLVFTHDAMPYYRDSNGDYWRCYVYVENCHSFDILEEPIQAFKAAQAFGQFQLDLADLPDRLNETIPHFHHAPRRLKALEKVMRSDHYNRMKMVGPEVDFVMQRASELDKLINLQAAGDIVERTTHNDTKLNNVLIDDFTGEGICVLDLDTVMPGLPHYDFGDMVRTGTSPAPEDETDLSKVYMRFDMFEALLRGYLDKAGHFLNDVEKELLPFSGKLMAMVIGIRFLTDFLDGDNYFKTSRVNHNLDRARSQFKLVESIEDQMSDMMKLLQEIK
ncbi:MAG: aminoglycoside phosphotransferase family protein [Lentisphaerae bacterium]|nr:aminoglycoside phosphotransferase family protein [Lentisphaerota bacterium]